MKQTIWQKEKGIAHLGVILTVVAVIAAVAFGGWWVWRNNTDNGQTNNTSQRPETKDNQEEEGIQIPENFMLYENTKIGFSFAYPKPVGPLMEASSEGNPSILSYVKSKNTKDDFASHTHSPLYVRVDKLEGFVTSAAKYGPVLEFINNKWIVTSKNGGDINNGEYAEGDEYKPPIVRTIEGVPIYDFSSTDEGCHYTMWIFKKEQAFISITLPVVCADEIDAVPQERLSNYQLISDQVLDTMTF